MPTRPSALAFALLISFIQIAICDYTLIQPLSVWSYDDTGTNDLAANYQSLGFNDSAFSTGIGVMGFGFPTGLGTTLSYGGNATNKILTYFFRKVVVSDSLLLRLGHVCTMLYNHMNVCGAPLMRVWHQRLQLLWCESLQRDPCISA